MSACMHTATLERGAALVRHKVVKTNLPPPRSMVVTQGAVGKAHGQVTRTPRLTSSVTLPAPSEKSETNADSTSTPQAGNLRSKKRNRPCKGKRRRFKRFVDNLKNQMSEDVESFNVEEVWWPPSLEANDRKRQQLIKLMEDLQHQLKDGKLNSAATS